MKWMEWIGVCLDHMGDFGSWDFLLIPCHTHLRLPPTSNYLPRPQAIVFFSFFLSTHGLSFQTPPYTRRRKHVSKAKQSKD